MERGGWDESRAVNPGRLCIAFSSPVFDTPVPSAKRSSSAIFRKISLALGISSRLESMKLFFFSKEKGKWKVCSGITSRVAQSENANAARGNKHVQQSLSVLVFMYDFAIKTFKTIMEAAIWILLSSWGSWRLSWRETESRSAQWRRSTPT